MNDNFLMKWSEPLCWFNISWDDSFVLSTIWGTFQATQILHIYCRAVSLQRTNFGPLSSRMCFYSLATPGSGLLSKTEVIYISLLRWFLFSFVTVVFIIQRHFIFVSPFYHSPCNPCPPICSLNSFLSALYSLLSMELPVLHVSCTLHSLLCC